MTCTYEDRKKLDALWGLCEKRDDAALVAAARDALPKLIDELNEQWRRHDIIDSIMSGEKPNPREYTKSDLDQARALAPELSAEAQERIAYALAMREGLGHDAFMDVFYKGQCRNLEALTCLKDAIEAHLTAAVETLDFHIHGATLSEEEIAKAQRVVHRAYRGAIEETAKIAEALDK